MDYFGEIKTKYLITGTKFLTYYLRGSFFFVCKVNQSKLLIMKKFLLSLFCHPCFIFLNGKYL